MEGNKKGRDGEEQREGERGEGEERWTTEVKGRNVELRRGRKMRVTDGVSKRWTDSGKEKRMERNKRESMRC